MAKHLDETPGRKVPVWQQANPYYVEDTPYPSRVQSKPKSSTKSNNSYKPSRSTKKGDTIGAGEYAVSKGDSLWKIAQAHGTTVEALKQANPEIKGNMIYPGQIINIGSKQNNTTTTSNNDTTITTRQSVADIIKSNSQRFANNNNATNNQTAGYTGSIFTNTQRNNNNVVVNRDNNGRQILISPFTQASEPDRTIVRANPREYQLTSPFTTPITEPDEPITYRKTLNPVVIKGKKTLKNTKGTPKPRRKINDLLNNEKEKQRLKQAQERQNRDFAIARQFYK